MLARMLRHALFASFADDAEKRISDRRVLRLEARLASHEGEGGIQVHNLSHTGMLVEGAVNLPVGEIIELELPGGEHHRAEVVWTDEGLFGCRFAQPLSQATLSAALLRSNPLESRTGHRPLTQDEAIARLREHWEFEQDDSEQAAVAVGASKLAPGTRMWIIGALASAAWALPVALAFLFW